MLPPPRGLTQEKAFADFVPELGVPTALATTMNRRWVAPSRERLLLVGDSLNKAALNILAGQERRCSYPDSASDAAGVGAGCSISKAASAARLTRLA